MSLISTSKAIKIGVQQLDWLRQLAEEMERVGNLEQKYNELHEKYADMQVDLARAEERLQSTTADIQDALVEASQIKREAEAKLESARTQAQVIIDSAGYQSCDDRAALIKEKAELTRDIQAKREQLDKLKAEYKRESENTDKALLFARDRLNQVNEEVELARQTAKTQVTAYIRASLDSE